MYHPVGNSVGFRFQQHQSSGAIPQRGGDSNLNQHSLRQSRNTQRPSMELIPPNPPNPKSARYSLNQQSADAGNNYKRPLGMSQGRGTVNRGERVQQNTYSTSGRGRGNLNFKNTPSANVSRSSSGGRMYQNRDQTSWGHGDEWNRGGSHGDYRERTGRMDSQVYDGDESSYQRVDSGWVHPDVGASRSVTNMDRRYAPIVSSFQVIIHIEVFKYCYKGCPDSALASHRCDPEFDHRDRQWFYVRGYGGCSLGD